MYLAKDAKHGIGRSSWLSRVKKTAYVDSGAAAHMFGDDDGMVDKTRTRNVFKGIAGCVKGDVDGNVHMWVYNPGR